MTHLRSKISWMLVTAALASVPVQADNPTLLKTKPPTSPLSLPLKWTTSNVYSPGLWMLDISIGTPEQQQTLIFDPSFSDIEIHSSSDEIFQKACKTEVPSFCSPCKFVSHYKDTTRIHFY